MAVRFAVLADKLKKKYRAFLREHHQMSFSEKKDIMGEIGSLSTKLSLISLEATKIAIRSKLHNFAENSISQATKERSRTLVSDSNSSEDSLLVRIAKDLQRSNPLDVSWFPRSRL